MKSMIIRGGLMELKTYEALVNTCDSYDCRCLYVTCKLQSTLALALS